MPQRRLDAWLAHRRRREPVRGVENLGDLLRFHPRLQAATHALIGVERQLGAAQRLAQLRLRGGKPSFHLDAQPPQQCTKAVRAGKGAQLGV